MDDRWGLFQKFLITQEQHVSLTDFFFNSLVIIVLTILLEYTYIFAARTISNRRQFAGTFILIAFTTMLIISIVKTSLALSLGLVGALSIVRFRAAIKEPEELAYIFFAISIGLGLGANQTMVVIEAFAIAMVIIWARYFLSRKSTNQNLYLNFSAKAGEVELEQVVDIVKHEFGKFHLKRYDENDQVIEASFVVDSPKPEKLQSFTKSISKLGSNTRVSFVESKSF
ncbi:MAG: DUF4956 domain-containing protein [Bacteroidetes bacterium]|nr:DUF4956 domain-containing protein [Bacteroidota bacterium]MBL6944518.1 DUF4956 domain-containing protein [Bacteroidales bacterium]